MPNSYNPFHLPIKPRWVASMIGKILRLNVLAHQYATRPHSDAENPAEHVDEFLQHVVQGLNINMTIENPEALDQIPRSGATILIANHPLGGLEGVAMSHLLRQIRPDLKVLTNELLSLIPEFSDLFIGVDVLSEKASAKNMRGMREVIKHLKNDGAILIYPAGMVSAINTRNWRIEDRQWSNIVGKLARQFSANCVPFYVHGKNSKLFYAVGLIHPRLRTAMLPAELANKSGRPVSLTIGSPIAWKDMKDLNDPDLVTAYLRTATYLLSHHKEKASGSDTYYPPLEHKKRSPEQEQQLAHDLQQIEDLKLIEHNEFDVYCAPYNRLGILMDEIAIARERTFRAVGEGTGNESDSDHFDPYYLHLFIWDRERCALVGGYRVACADKIIEQHGVDGLYSRSLYHFDENYIHRIGGALEVGRSFVSQEYQRHPRALDLLWRGIGRWVVKNPGYHTLFGCVSISREHSQRAREFLNDSLMQSFRAEQSLLNDVRPVTPLKIKHKIWTNDVLASLSNITLINKLLGQCDPGKNVPILLRQYLALNGKFLGFSINHSFNDSLDGLILVDLRKTPTKYLNRYLGKVGSEQFMKQWSNERDAA